MDFKVNKDRLNRNLEELGAIGICETGGLDRHFGSAADLQARGWLTDLWKEYFGTEPVTDPAANLWETIAGGEELPAIAVGSHHDTVKNGGRYDGAMGVLLATEAAKRLCEEKITLRHPLKVVAFTGEEPNPFGVSTLGSKLVSGKLTAAKLSGAKSVEDGVTIAEALKRAGGNFEKLDKVRLQPGRLSTFIECHIEQGRVLEEQGLPVGAVSQITGIYRENVHIVGDANHSGTTLMRYRHDALLAAAEVMLEIERIVKEAGRDDLVATSGHIEVSPNSPNIIPGDTALTLEIRTPDRKLLNEVLAKLGDAMKKIIGERGVDIVRNVTLDQDAADMDGTIAGALQRAAEESGEKCPVLVSMAGHDAAHMARVTRPAMLFVRTKDGRSHCPREFADIDDIVTAGNALMKAIIILDRELD